MAIDPQTSTRCKGALLGLAVGDAVGTTVEFMSPGTFEPVTDMVGGGPFDLRVGKWTDDTSMALCLGESLLIKGGFDPVHQMGLYLNWYHRGYHSSTGVCFDIGNTVRQALTLYERTGKPFSGSTDPQSAGNGSLMRLAPVPIFYLNDPEKAIEMAANSSRTTHGATAAVDACRYYAGLMMGAMQGESKEKLLASRYHPTRGSWKPGELCEDIDIVARGSFRTKEDSEIRGTGYVVHSMEAALWAFATTDDFKSGCLKAVNLGDDADTTAAIYGQLAGAYYGEEGIPGEWRIKLHKATEISGMAIELLTSS